MAVTEVSHTTRKAFALYVPCTAWGKTAERCAELSAGALVVTDCNRNGSGLQSTEIGDHIMCIYPSLQDRIICH